MSQVGGCTEPRPLKLDTDPFTLGVASGDPSPDGAVLWTRLAPDPLHGGGMPAQPVDVAWQIARDDAMKDVARSGTAKALPELAHPAHVEVTGLEPDRASWWRVRVPGLQRAQAARRAAAGGARPARVPVGLLRRPRHLLRPRHPAVPLARGLSLPRAGRGPLRLLSGEPRSETHDARRGAAGMA